MSTTPAATRLLLFADAPRAPAPGPVAPIRRYRLGRLDPDAARRAGAEPRYAHLKQSHD